MSGPTSGTLAPGRPRYLQQSSTLVTLSCNRNRDCRSSASFYKAERKLLTSCRLCHDSKLYGPHCTGRKFRITNRALFVRVKRKDAFFIHAIARKARAAEYVSTWCDLRADHLFLVLPSILDRVCTIPFSQLYTYTHSCCLQLGKDYTYLFTSLIVIFKTRNSRIRQDIERLDYFLFFITYQANRTLRVDALRSFHMNDIIPVNRSQGVGRVLS